MHVGVIGINHKLADLKLREKLAKACHKLFRPGCFFYDGHHCILLSTCNRTEVYFSSHDLPTTHIFLLDLLRSEVEEDFEHKLYSYFGSDSFAHLVRVAAGLDSAIIAETEIQGQVKAAYEQASEFHTFPKDLHILFQKSLMISKKIRSELHLGRGMPNLEHAIFTTGKHFFKTIENISVLFVGASDINEKILSFLKTKKINDITLCNRSHDTAQEIASQHEINLMDWDQLSTAWHNYQWVIFGTKAPEFLISRSGHLNHFVDHKLIMDLSVPRNVDPLLGRDPRITLLNIDQINRLLNIRRRCMSETVAAAEVMIQASTKHHVQRHQLQQQSKLVLLSA